MSTVIDASLVKKLREHTGAGMMDCKRALIESNGDFDQAFQAMRKSGAAKADKKADRVTAEGTVVCNISADQKHAVLIEVNCETDFVARANEFMQFADNAAQRILAENLQSTESAAADETIQQARADVIAKLGENIQIRRFVNKTTSHQWVCYVHTGRIAALVEIEGGDEALGRDIAMHIVASAPQVVDPHDVPETLIQQEKEVFSAQALNSGKPANIIEKMIEGRIKKFTDEISLMGQPFLKNPEQSVGQLLESRKAKVHSFVRYAAGEGIEKKVTDFAEEVMAQVKGS